MGGPVTISVIANGVTRTVVLEEAEIEVRNEVIDTTKPGDVWKTYIKGPHTTITISGKRVSDGVHADEQLSS